MRIKLPPSGVSVLRELCRHHELTRRDIQGLLDVSGSTVTRIATHLSEIGLTHSAVISEGNLGRPAEAIRLAPDGLGMLAVSMSARETSIALVALTGEVSDVSVLPVTAETPYEEAVTVVADAVRLLASTANQRFHALAGLGVSFGGSVSFRDGRIADASSFPDWRGKALAHDLEVATGIRTQVDNQPVAIIRALSWFGPTANHNRFLCFADNGLAGCVSPPLGPFPDNGLTSGNFGHVNGRDTGERQCWCGLYDCLNTIASLRMLAAWAAEHGLVDDHAAPAEVVAALEGSAEGRARLTLAGHTLTEHAIDACRVLGTSDYVLAGRLFDLSPTARTAAHEVMSSAQGAHFHGEFVPPGFAEKGSHLAAAAVIADGMSESDLVDVTPRSTTTASAPASRKGATPYA